jgi:predicted SAM-dependent methyltransferase
MRPSLAKLLAQRTHVWLDVACGESRPDGYLGMNPTPGDKVDVVHDYRATPWPFPAETFTRLVMSKVVERLLPETLFKVMDEAWRVLKPNGLLMVSTPYAGSWGSQADPYVLHAWNEGTPSCFDPAYPFYNIYKPKPWRIEQNVWHADGNLEIAFRKRSNGTS